MSKASLLWEITRWELMRWLKLKDQVQTLVLSVVLGLAVWGGLALFQKVDRDPINVAVMHPDRLPFNLSGDGPFELALAGEHDEAALLAALEAGEIDALLRLESYETAEIIVTREPIWQGELETILNGARQQAQIADADLDPQMLSKLFEPVDLRVAYHETASPPTSWADKVAAGFIISLMMVGVFTGLAYQFIVITGEKQLRVTEQIVSAVKPQLWIDGKILGISLLALATTGTYLASSLGFVLLSKAFGKGLPIPLAINDPMLWLQVGLLAMAGFLLWNTFFGLIAATINDPNTSSRGGLMLLPLLPLAIPFLGMSHLEAPWMRVLAILPPTSPTVLTMRLILADVPAWEFFLALLLLALSIGLLRKAAGKVFGLAILMVGKEPTWGEIARWIKEA